MKTIINEYFTEFTIGVTIVILLVTYVLLKTSQKKEDTKSKKRKKHPKDETIATVDNVVKQKLHVKQTTTPTNIDRKKREVPLHDKITKDDFSIFKNIKVLIAEDNVINQKVITSLLSTSGIDITIANDGQECLDILKNDSNFSMIFMDAHMPIIDGFQATRIIRQNQNYNHIPVVALSGDTAADDIKNMMNVGMEAHLEKPLRMDALYDVLYTYTTGNETQENFKKVNETLQEFNCEKGLEICGDDKEFYIEILNDFMSKYTNSSNKIQECLKNSDATCADKMLLDISGIAANIGADILHQSTLDLKNSIANPNDLEYINNLKSYERSLNIVLEAIKAYKAL